LLHVVETEIQHMIVLRYFNICKNMSQLNYKKEWLG